MIDRTPPPVIKNLLVRNASEAEIFLSSKYDLSVKEYNFGAATF